MSKWRLFGGRGSLSGMQSSRERENRRNGNEQYHEFAAKAIVERGGWFGSRGRMEYEDDNGEARNFFEQNSNFLELLNSMGRNVVEAFNRWTEGHFMHGEQYRGFDNMSAEDQMYTRIFDRILDKSRLDRGVVVVRAGSAKLLGLPTDLIQNIDQVRRLIGQTVTSKGSMSFAAASEGLDVGTTKNTEYRLKIAGGTVGSGMWVGHDTLSGWGDSQREFMTNRDIDVRIDGVSQDSKTGRYIVDLTYVGRRAHDYGSQSSASSGRSRRRV